MDQNIQNKRNGEIDLIRFLLVVVIMLFHARGIMDIDIKADFIFTRGASATEGLFIISGFFMAHAAVKYKRSSIDYIARRYRRVFPIHTFSFICAFIITCIKWGYLSPLNVKEIFLLIIKSVPEFFILAPMAGLKYDFAGINGIEWFLGALVLGSAIIYPILKRKPKQYCLYIGPLVFLFLSGYLYQTVGSYRATYDITTFFCNGLIRAIALLSFGTFLYWLNIILKEKIKDTTKNKLLLTLMIILCWFVVVLFFYKGFIPKKNEFAIVYFMGAALLLMFTEKSYLNPVFNNKFVYYLGELSLPLYINQGWIRKLFIYYNFGERFSYVENVIFFGVAAIAIAIVSHILIKRVLHLPI